MSLYIGQLYLEWLPDVAASDEEAMYWLVMACKGGNTDARKLMLVSYVRLIILNNTP